MFVNCLFRTPGSFFKYGNMGLASGCLPVPSKLHLRFPRRKPPMRFLAARIETETPTHSFTVLDLGVSSLRRVHANLRFTVPVLTDDPLRESKPGSLAG